MYTSFQFSSWVISVITALCLSGAPPEPSPSVDHAATDSLSGRTERVVVLTGEYTADTTIEADRVIIAAGSSVRILGGAKVTVVADVLQIDGPAFIDGRGRAGPDRPSSETWWSSGGDGWGHAHVCGIAHRDWESAGSVDYDGGIEGGPGSFFSVRYRALEGVRGGLDNLVADMSGGLGGRGRILRCGCHDHDIKFGPSGRSGANGTFTITHVME